MDFCDSCKEIQICSCENFCLSPVGGITPGEDYILSLTDKFNIKYTQEITANDDGALCVDVTGFPDGFFNPYAGRMIVSVALASEPDTDIQLIYGSLEYTCISLKIKECPNSSSSVVIPTEDCLCGGGKILSGTYAEIVTALTAGIDTSTYSQVRITDFQSIYDQPDFDNTGTAKVTVVTKTSSVTEPLLIGLLNANTLKPEAYSALYPKDQIRYDITFNQTEVMAAAAKGRIIERIDHLNNRTDYDHRHVVFLRYESAPASAIFNQYKDNGGATQEFTTFQFAQEIIDDPILNAGGFSNNNFIGDFALLFIPYGNPFLLSNNVFGKRAEENKMPQYTLNNTFGEICAANVFTLDCSNCIFGNNTNNNHVGGIYDSVFGNQFNLNSFPGQIIGTVAGNGFSGNRGLCIQTCIFGNACIFNDFGQSITSLTFADGLTQNNFKNTSSGVDFSLATHVYATYNCDVFYDSAAILKLFYFDGAGTLTVANAIA